ncbi:hypothetical protein [Gracilibacillus alcaliphilus]|uniref:hypothetical protein n=1 Tax=Gracilibacillus alcaliphilus TaxID=1401441 RepID=UPI0019598DDB|nr:hypothetical protein [Gracilibacillus alcaliphilus]MBM7678480.1 hypothetical protein [Gracilibacillus alcaliphilus]
MIIAAEVLQVIAVAVLVFSSFMYLNDLTKRKKERGLSTFESVMLVIVGIAIFALAISRLILIFA